MDAGGFDATSNYDGAAAPKVKPLFLIGGLLWLRFQLLTM